MDERGPAVSPLAGVDLNLLVPLHALLTECSVTRAAARVGISQPAMSHALRRCRALLRDELLIRVGSSMEPTPRARRLVGPLTAVLASIDDSVLDRAGFVPAATTRTFRISATSTTALVVLPPLLRRLRRLAPGAVLHSEPSVTPGEKLVDQPGIDLALLADAVPTDLHRQRLYTDRWVAVVATDHASVADAITLDQLATLPHVAFDTAPQRRPLAPYEALDRLGVQYTVRMQVHDFLLAPLVLAGSDLVACTQERAAWVLAAGGLVRILPLPLEVDPLGIDMVWDPRRVADLGALWLREQVVAAMHPVNDRDDDHSFDASG